MNLRPVNSTCYVYRDTFIEIYSSSSIVIFKSLFILILTLTSKLSKNTFRFMQNSNVYFISNLTGNKRTPIPHSPCHFKLCRVNRKLT